MRICVPQKWRRHRAETNYYQSRLRHVRDFRCFSERNREKKRQGQRQKPVMWTVTILAAFNFFRAEQDSQFSSVSFWWRHLSLRVNERWWVSSTSQMTSCERRYEFGLWVIASNRRGHDKVLFHRRPSFKRTGQRNRYNPAILPSDRTW